MALFGILLGVGLIAGLLAAVRAARARPRRRQPILVRVDAAAEGSVSIVGARSGLWYRDADSVDEARQAAIRLGLEATRQAVLEPYLVVPRDAVPPSAYRLPESSR